MTTSSEGTQTSVLWPWNFGVRGRLLLAFFGITAFAVLAAAAGIYAFREVGGRLEIVDARIPPTLSALELSRSAERIIAVAPALLATTDPGRRDEIKAALGAELKRLNAIAAELEGVTTGSPSLAQIEQLVSALTDALARLDDLVARRVASENHIARLRQRMFQTNSDTERLLAPWLDVLGSQIELVVSARPAAPAKSRTN